LTARRPVVVHLTTIDMSLALLLLPQLRAFAAAGFRVVGVSAASTYVDALRDHGIDHIPLGRSTRSMNVRDDLSSARDFARICRRLRPEIVHTHNPKPGIYGRVVARTTRTPVVVNTVHGLYAQATDPLSRRLPVYVLERCAAAFSHAELVQNPEDMDTLRRLGVPARRLHLLGNGVDLARFDPSRHASARAPVRAELGIGPDEVLVGVVGRLVREKGYRELFAAARSLRERGSRARFVVLGPSEPDKHDGIAASELQAAIGDGVIHLGVRHDVERLYAAMDVFCLPSHREGFPRAAMEAAAMGLPVVASDIRGCRQVVDHGRTGLLVPVADPRALAAAIQGMVDDEAGRAAMGGAARQRARREFDDRRQVEITLDVYRRLLRDRTSRASNVQPGSGRRSP
jgi:glycosyltransferase involved in cell wall biosynthesis